jgi:alkanesulfonate monooxygenase SsuD/methylene tetrahydromethanopterin reductase-like flavin-dependent oxidoreductase (luciferase family)
MAVALERAKFDLLLLGDSLAVPGTYQGRMDVYLRDLCGARALSCPESACRHAGRGHAPHLHGPHAVDNLYPPFLLARLLTTLDHLSRGRMAWNVVTSYKHEEALNFGY